MVVVVAVVGESEVELDVKRFGDGLLESPCFLLILLSDKENPLKVLEIVVDDSFAISVDGVVNFCCGAGDIGRGADIPPCVVVVCGNDKVVIR